MIKNYLSESFDSFKMKFATFFTHKKKVVGLENFCSATDCPAAKFLPLMKSILREGFLDEEEEKFLEYQIHKAEIDALTWSHKTKWVRGQIRVLQAARVREDRQMALPFIDFDKKKSLHVPVEILSQQQNISRVNV